MTERQMSVTARRPLVAQHPTGPAPACCKDRGTPFTFHGHRLSSLYREKRRQLKPFIFLKILKKLSVVASAAIEYLEKDESRMGVRA
ncbi:hypothetical protein VK792_02960 [Mesobacterium sp. TK19101]|uniref:Uncharacterized protein n=2 Tax=Mesobacterium hydrothermale TaxID=3111907 RepID=A0ABU6HD72_9RHOB|nr:hypothetical protein [Mesobacterium sp. TK19101]